MKNICLEIKERGCEVLILTLKATTEDGKKVSKNIDLGGNSTSAAHWGAISIVKALKELEEEQSGK